MGGQRSVESRLGINMAAQNEHTRSERWWATRRRYSPHLVLQRRRAMDTSGASRGNVFSWDFYALTLFFFSVGRTERRRTTETLYET